jgi:DNA polymerase III epsilon subunit-like protein
MLVYDIGYCIVDKKGNVYKTGSYIVSEIFFGEEEKMNSSYYALKIPKYYKEIGSSDRKVRTWSEISWLLRKDIETYNIKTIVAHNARFDFGALNNTKKYLNAYSLLPYLEWYDTLKMARSVLGKMPTYKKFCEDNGYKTKNNQLRYTAEIIYRFISKNDNFVENHTGLEDTLIEKEILRYCYKQHKKMDKLLFA